MNTRSMDEIYNMIADANHKMYDLWTADIVFSWRWWLNVALTIFPWVIWIKVRNKKRTPQLLFVGLVVIIITNCLNNIGLVFHFWHYDWKVTPLAIIFIPWDYSLFPVIIMLLLQTKPKINAYIKAISFAFCTAFILEPFYSWIGLYQPITWKYWYSFIIYIPLYLLWDKIYSSKLLNT